MNFTIFLIDINPEKF
jgi:hypothetical protein